MHRRADELPAPGSSGWRASEGWAAPDLIYRPDAENGWVVCDHKSGAIRDSRSYRAAVEQVTTYLPMLRHGLALLAPDEPCRGRLILLGDGSEEEWEITPSEIDAAESRIRTGARRMASMRTAADEAEEAMRAQIQTPAPAEKEQLLQLERARRSAYPMTVVRSRCRYCQFRELCAPELGIEPDTTDNDHPADADSDEAEAA